MTSFQIAFFWSVKVRVEKRAWWSWALDAVRRFKHHELISSCISSRWNGVESELLSVYSPGERRKKEVMIIIPAMALVFGFCECWVKIAMQLMTCTGIDLT